MKRYTYRILKYIFCLLLFIMVSVHGYSQGKNEVLHIEFVPSFKGEDLMKEKWYVTENKDSIRITKLKFYGTDFKIKTKDEKEYSLINSNYLIDVFNKETLIIKRIENINIEESEFSFKIGVKESLNVSGANSGDLDPSKGMFWSWQSGYINFKIEGVSPSCNTRKNKFQFHIGGYKMPYETVRTVVFKLSKCENNRLKINFDVSKLFEDIQLKTQNQIMIPGQEASSIADKVSTLFSIDE